MNTVINRKYEEALDQLRLAAIKNQVGEEYMELPDTRADGPGTFSFSQEAYLLRVVALFIKIRLAELGIILDGIRPQTWSDGEFKYRVSTIAKDKFEVDEDVLKIADKELYESLTTQILDKAKLRKLIDEGRVEGWQRFASFNPGTPYVHTSKEVLEQAEAPVVMDVEVQK